MDRIWRVDVRFVLVWMTAALAAPLPALSEQQASFGILAVSLQNIEQSKLRELKIRRRYGVFVTDVFPGGEASNAGLEVNDIILRGGDRTFRKPEDLVDWLQTTEDGEQYSLSILRQTANGRWSPQRLDYTSVWKSSGSQLAASDGPLEVTIREPIVYLSETKGDASFFRQQSYDWFVRVKYGGQSPVRGFFDIEGTPTKTEVSSSDADILEIGPRGFTFHRPGEVAIHVAVGDHQVELAVRVVRSPVATGDSTTEVIEALGLPDDKKKILVSWPKSEVHDGLFYKPTARESIISAEHWRYDDYPELVIAIRGRHVERIASDAKELKSQQFRKEYLREIDEREIAAGRMSREFRNVIDID